MGPIWAHMGPNPDLSVYFLFIFFSPIDESVRYGDHTCPIRSGLGPIWALMGPYMGPCGPLWAHMGPYGALMGPPGQDRT